jgi:hypothetical protein
VDVFGVQTDGLGWEYLGGFNGDEVDDQFVADVLQQQILTLLLVGADAVALHPAAPGQQVAAALARHAEAQEAQARHLRGRLLLLPRGLDLRAHHGGHRPRHRRAHHLARPAPHPRPQLRGPGRDLLPVPLPPRLPHPGRRLRLHRRGGQSQPQDWRPVRLYQHRHRVHGPDPHSQHHHPGVLPRPPERDQNPGEVFHDRLQAGHRRGRHLKRPDHDRVECNTGDARGCAGAAEDWQREDALVHCACELRC